LFNIAVNVGMAFVQDKTASAPRNIEVLQLVKKIGHDRRGTSIYTYSATVLLYGVLLDR
jgi:hypothetical protein